VVFTCKLPPLAFLLGRLENWVLTVTELVRCIAVILTIVATTVGGWKLLTDMMVNITVTCV